MSAVARELGEAWAVIEWDALPAVCGHRFDCDCSLAETPFPRGLADALDVLALHGLDADAEVAAAVLAVAQKHWVTLVTGVTT